MISRFQKTQITGCGAYRGMSYLVEVGLKGVVENRIGRDEIR